MRTKEWIFFRHIAPKILALRQQAGRFFVQSAEKISRPLVHPDLISASLTKKTKKNEGEVPQYYVEGSHPAIIPPVKWDTVQVELARRKGIGKAYSGASVFSAKLVCADCGEFFGQKVWHSTDAYRKEIWRCNHKFAGEKKCTTPHLVVEQIQALFLQAYNDLMQDRSQIIADCAVMHDTLLDTSAIQAHIAKVDAELEVTAALVAAAVKENATLPQSQTAYREKFAALEQQYTEQKTNVLHWKRRSRKGKRERMSWTCSRTLSQKTI